MISAALFGLCGAITTTYLAMPYTTGTIGSSSLLVMWLCSTFVFASTTYSWRSIYRRAVRQESERAEPAENPPSNLGMSNNCRGL
ncbi:hypothetical protein SAMN04489718_0839 [Actinopolyspora saharensis]|uniref:Uncharacterized protein n=1 Tax=Actinopolyspora saharensis TaxID=995062 RepID=A0A1H0Z4I0_9ACTN|nr:hypothetical protein SAMN04489718_0839 [Actinopolyspora saharensis]